MCIKNVYAKGICAAICATGFVVFFVSGLLYQVRTEHLLADYTELANVLARYFIAFLFLGAAKCCMKCKPKK